MNPYDPSDTLSDNSDDYSVGMYGSTTAENAPNHEKQLKKNVVHEELRFKECSSNEDYSTTLTSPQNEEEYSDEVVSDEIISGGFVTSMSLSGGAVTIEPLAYAEEDEIKFSDPHNEIDVPQIEEMEENVIFAPKGNAVEEEPVQGEEPVLEEDPIETEKEEILDLNEEGADCLQEELNKDPESPPHPTHHQRKKWLDSNTNASNLQTSTSSELVHLLKKAKALFSDKSIDVTEPCNEKTVSSNVKIDAVAFTASSMELLDIEKKLRDCKLVRSKDIFKLDKRLNQLSLRQVTKPPIAEKSENNDTIAFNFCDLLYKANLIDKDIDGPPAQEKQDTEPQKPPPKYENFRSIVKSKQIDDFKILQQAVQLLESRTSLPSISNNCRGILGILALQRKLKELTTDKESLETRLYKCNSDFMEFIDILSDKARIICINNKEVGNFIKVLNLKVPELESITSKYTESLENVKYKFKEKNLPKIIELKNQISFFHLNIEKLKKKITKIQTENVDIKHQMDNLENDNVDYKYDFNKKIIDVKSNMENLNTLNSSLQRQLEVVQNSDLGRNENFKQKIPSLKEEIETLSNNIKTIRHEKNDFEIENVELRKKLKKLILEKVMEKRSSTIPEVP